MDFNVQAILTEIQNARIGGLNDDQVRALVHEQVQPVADRLALDEAQLTEIRALVDTLGSVDTDLETVVTAIVDKLAETPAPETAPETPAEPASDASAEVQLPPVADNA